MGTACSRTLPSQGPSQSLEPRPVDPKGETRIRFYKEFYPALRDEDFEWMKKTKGALIIMGEDRADVESLNAKVYRHKTEEAIQKAIKGRLLADTTVLRWYDVYAVPQYDFLFIGCHDVDQTTGCVRLVYPVTVEINHRKAVELRCIVDTGAPISIFYDSLYEEDPNQATGFQAIGSEKYGSQLGRCSVTINETIVHKRFTLALVNRKVKGYDGIIGYDLLKLCHMTVHRGKSLLVVSAQAI